MHKQTLFLSSLALLLGCGAPQDEPPPSESLGALTGSVNADGPDIRLTERGLYFGNVCGQEDAVRVLGISNVGDERLRVDGMGVSGTGFSIQNRPPLPLRLSPGQRFNLRVRFDPDGDRVEPYEGTLRIRSNDPDEEEINVPLGALSLPGSIRVSPRQHSFGTVDEGESRSVQVTLRSEGDCPVLLDRIRVTGSLSHTISVDRLPERIDPGEVERIRVRFECDGEDDSLEVMLRFIDAGGRSVGSMQLTGACED